MPEEVSEKNYKVFAAWFRSREEALNRYYGLLEYYAKYLIKKDTFGKIDGNSFAEWKTNFMILSSILKPYTKTITSDFFNLNNYKESWLIEKTQILINLKIIHQLTSIGIENYSINHVIKYGRENYKDNTISDMNEIDEYIGGIQFE